MDLVDIKIRREDLDRLNKLIEVYETVSTGIHNNVNSDDFSVPVNEMLSRARDNIDIELSMIARCALIR